MPATMNDDNKAYEKLVKRFPLRPIRSGEQNDRAGKICDELTDRVGDLSEAERDYLEVLSELIAKYESRWDQEALEMSPRELIHYLMGQNGLAQKDLISEFGSASRVSEFLKGERSLSLEQTKRLAYRFRLNIGALIERDDSPSFV
jgi:HTH-type transcriptional regulator/antitoxin HigA